MQTFSGSVRNSITPEGARQVRQALPVESACSQAICDYLSEQCGNPVPDSEQAFLAICIHRACV